MNLSVARLKWRDLGFGLYWAWVYVCFYSSAIFPRAPQGVRMVHSHMLISAAATTVTLLALSLFARFFPMPAALRLRREPLIMAFAVLVSAGTLAMSLSVTGSHQILFTCGAIATGIGTAWIVLRWGEFYGGIGMFRATVCMSLSLVAASVVYFLVVSLPATAAVVLTVALPIGSAALAWGQPRDPELEAARIAETTPPRHVLPSALIIGLLAYGLVFGAMRGLTGFPQTFTSFAAAGRLSVLGGAILALLVAVSALITSKGVDFVFAYRPILPLMVAGFLLLPFVGSGTSAVAAAIVGTGYACLDLWTWIVLSHIAHRLHTPTPGVFGWGKAAETSGVLAGWLIGYQLASRSALTSGELTAFALATVFVLVVVTVLVLNERGVATVWGLDKEAVETEMPAGHRRPGLWRDCCAAIAAAHSLSRREEEVMLLLAKGRTVPHISDALGIARGTTQTHVAHIYSKLGIHSRQELIELVDAELAKRTDRAGDETG